MLQFPSNLLINFLLFARCIDSQCVDMVHERLLAIATRCQKGGAGGVAARFPLLADRIEALVAEQLEPLSQHCKAKVISC